VVFGPFTVVSLIYAPLCIYNSVISALHLGLMILSSVVNNTTNHALLELNFDWVSVARQCVWFSFNG
jgi:hypothetical protein